MPPPARRLADLLVDPRETLEVELKDWLDVANNQEHKATLAKALIALANHGGGFVLIGFTRGSGGAVPAPNRPIHLAEYTPDTINATVLAYADPVFHCDVNIVTGPDGLQYPIITVPGGHRAPIKARRDGPNQQGIRKNSYYIRRPGPQSEVPQDGQEWDALIRRCISNARDEMMGQIRAILSGAKAESPPEHQADALRRWHDASLARWRELTHPRQPDDPARLTQGYFALSYSIGDVAEPKLGSTLLESLGQAKVRHTGWPEFWVPTRDGIRPYMHDGNVECWIDRDGQAHGAAHCDFWRASPDGKLFLIRGYQEDEAPEVVAAGRGFDVTIPTWRVGEALLHAAKMASEFGDPSAQITALFEWTGLRGRSLTHLERTRIIMPNGHTSQQAEFRTGIAVQADQIPNALPELVAQVVVPLYELFDFFRLPATLVSEELTKMRSNQF